MNDSNTNPTIHTPQIFVLGTVNGVEITASSLSMRTLDDMLNIMSDLDGDMGRIGRIIRSQVLAIRERRDEYRTKIERLNDALMPFIENTISEMITERLDARIDELDIEDTVKDAVSDATDHMEDAIKENIESDLSDTISDKIKEDLPYYLGKELKNVRLTID
jgi:hypothetical protein